MSRRRYATYPHATLYFSPSGCFYIAISFECASRFSPRRAPRRRLRIALFTFMKARAARFTHDLLHRFDAHDITSGYYLMPAYHFFSFSTLADFRAASTTSQHITPIYFPHVSTPPPPASFSLATAAPLSESTAATMGDDSFTTGQTTYIIARYRATSSYIDF